MIVGTKEDLYKDEVIINDVNLLLFDDINEEIDVNVKTRYSTQEAKAKAIKINKNEIRLKFEEPQARITPRSISCNVYR